MSVSDYDLSILCCGIYAYSGDDPVLWDYFNVGKSQSDNVCWAMKRVNGINVIVFQGTADIAGIMRDLDAIASPFNDGEIGPVHPGAYHAAKAAFEKASSLGFTSQPYIVTGHSLGAMEATLFAAIGAKRETPILSRVVFGEPKPGFKQLSDILKNVPGRSYVNMSQSSEGAWPHYDAFTSVPATIWPEEYTHPTQLIPVCAVPPDDDPWRFLGWHHMKLYLKAMKFNSVITVNKLAGE
jgi:hypothetical protein